MQENDDDEEDEEAEEYGGRKGRSKGRSAGGAHRFLDESDEEGRDGHDYSDEYDDEDIDRDHDGGYTSDPEMRTAKRSYKFGGDRAYSEKRERAQSAKPNNRNRSQKSGGAFDDERNLRHTKLTT